MQSFHIQLVISSFPPPLPTVNIFLCLYSVCSVCLATVLCFVCLCVIRVLHVFMYLIKGICKAYSLSEIERTGHKVTSGQNRHSTHSFKTHKKNSNYTALRDSTLAETLYTFCLEILLEFSIRNLKLQHA